MSSIDILSMALRNLFKRKLRTFLTVLGVVIGTASIVIMISLGIGVNMSFDEQLKNMGDVTKIEIYNNTYSMTKDSKRLLDGDVDEMLKIKHVVAATPVLNSYITTMIGKYTAGLQLYGIRAEAMEAMGYKAADGRLLQAGDTLQIVYGSRVPLEYRSARDRYSGGMWGGRGGGMAVSIGGEEPAEEKPKVDVLNDKITASFVQGFGEKSNNADENDTGKSSTNNIKPYKFVGVGILEQGNNWDAVYNCFMDIKQVKEIDKARIKYENSQNGTNKKPEDNGYSQAFVKVDDMNNVQEVIDQIMAMGFDNVWSSMQYMDDMKEMTGSLQALLGAIGAVSLFVAAIGIANTMVMSIYERTKEIGVMKVIGASLRDIQAMFLVEAGVIGIMGGLFGVALSYGISFILNNVGISFLSRLTWSESSTVSFIPLWLCLLALGFSFLVGVVSGFFPARRATKISALSAIKTE